MTTNDQSAREIRLGHSFDQFQRYQDVRQVIDQVQAARPDRPLRVLDVGGTPTAARFLSGYRLVTTNIETVEATDCLGDGTRLPFKDAAFEVTITVDTLEHLPEPSREPFIAELLRVSSAYVIITGPFANGYNENAETILNEFLIEVAGIQHRFLLEHLAYGLPHLDSCLQTIRRVTERVIAIPSGYLHHWLPLMVTKYALAQLRDGWAINEEIDRLYNETNYLNDHRLPSYRQLVVAAKENDAGLLAQIGRSFTPTDMETTPDLNGVMAMHQAMRWQQLLAERDQEIERLQNLVTAYRSGRVMRLLAALHKLVGQVKR